jgi:MoxR-like ATPase
MTPFLKRVGFSELLLTSPGAGGAGYWTVPEHFRPLLEAAVDRPPEAKRFATEQEWIEWFCEGTSATVTVPPPPPLHAAIPVMSLTLAALRAALEKYESDLVFSDGLLASLVAALRSGDGRNFIILRGVSGTGKSRLVAAIAKAVYGSDAVDMPNLTIVEVRPDWTDGSYLLGHHDPITGRYVRQRFLNALLAADEARRITPSNPEPFFVCLDEMNLARVEYYLADCLSAMESGNPIPLDTRGDISVSAVVAWPPNLYLFATVNVDESTHRISDKVLDRAQVVDTSDIDLIPQLQRWLLAEANLSEPERSRVLEIVGGTWTMLRDAGVQFGFRTGKAIVRFVSEARASSGGAVSVDDAVDTQLVQKVLVKLRGEGERWATTLAELEQQFDQLAGERRSHAVVRRMRSDLERLGSFQFWN